MNYFKEFSSNTLAPSSNQSWFQKNGEKTKGRSFYKVFAGGKYNYSFLFVNAIDSTYGDGTYSKANMRCDNWVIHSAGVYVTKNISNDLDSKEKHQLYFENQIEKKVISEEIFYSDKILLNCEKDDYICLEIEFSGFGKIPYMEETLIPTFVLNDGKWTESKQIPLCAMVGCDRKITKKIAFLGDSITEGIGTSFNSYKWWNSRIAEYIGDKNSYWNLGIGFARANDAATDKSWLNKAKKADTVTVCLGVNDIGQGLNAEKIKSNLCEIVSILQKENTDVIIFTVPPFDYNEKEEAIWRDVNNYIKNDIAKYCEVFDTVEIWGQTAPNDHIARYGGHPNEEGSDELAKKFVSKFNDKTYI